MIRSSRCILRNGWWITQPIKSGGYLTTRETLPAIVGGGGAESQRAETVYHRQQNGPIHLLNGGRLAVGDPQHVPAGIYAKEALQSWAHGKTLEPKLAPGEDVRGALALVERNEAPLGIVYGS